MQANIPRTFRPSSLSNPQPKGEPDLLACSCELRNCLFALGGLHQALWRSAFLPTPTEEPPVAPESDRLEGVLRDSCNMAKALVREAQAINAKLIGPSK